MVDIRVEDTMNQLTVITDEVGQDLEEVLRLIAPFQLTHVELRTIWNKNIVLFSDAELQRLKRVLDAHDLAVSVISGPIFKCMLPTSRLHRKKKKSFTFNTEYNLSFIDRVIEIADFMGCDKVRAFSFFKGVFPPDRAEAWPYVVDQVREYVGKAKDANKTVVLENEGPCWVDSMDACCRLLEEIPDPHLQLICDPGNFYMAKPKHVYAPADYDPIISRTGHMHVKDPKRKIPFFALFGVVGEGKIDYPGIFQRYLDHGYEGFFSLETHSLRKRQERSIASLKSMRAMLAGLRDAKE